MFTIGHKIAYCIIAPYFGCDSGMTYDFKPYGVESPAVRSQAWRKQPLPHRQGGDELRKGKFLLRTPHLKGVGLICLE